jgi:hypothetical protein
MKKALNSFEVSESLISQSMLKRKEWSKKYRISDKMIYDLFSEFSGMIMISKFHSSSSKPEKMKEVLPSEYDLKMSKKLRPSINLHPYTFDQKDMSDFRIPLETFKEYSSTMKGLNKDCQNSYLNAMGVDVNYPGSKIDWEKHIQLSCLLKFDNCTLDEYIDFFKKVLDPANKGLVPKE